MIYNATATSHRDNLLLVNTCKETKVYSGEVHKSFYEKAQATLGYKVCEGYLSSEMPYILEVVDQMLQPQGSRSYF